jgi:hypothetical protein
MLAAPLSWLGGKIAGPLAMACALLFAGVALWQTARIDGAPLLGGGFKAQIAALQGQIAARDLAAAKAEAAALAARQQWTAQAEAEARAHAATQAKTETQIQTVIEKVPVYVSEKASAACVVPWGAVRLLDAAASGADPDIVRAAIAPGQPDDAASDVTLPEAVALLTTDLGLARQNADQLEHLERAVAATDGKAD